MSRFINGVSILILCMGINCVWADQIGGVPLADFDTNELTIPCVQVNKLDGISDGSFFDVMLKKKDDSFTYELVFVQVEDADLCQRIADFSTFEDDDFDDGMSAEDDSVSDGIGAKLLISCEKRTGRSKISVDAKGLIAGNYYSIVNSGASQAQSSVLSPIGGEVEFDFDSDPGDIAEGAIAISTDFIQASGSVSAGIIDQASGETIKAAIAVCLIK